MCVCPGVFEVEECEQMRAQPNKAEPDSRNSNLPHENKAQGPKPQGVSDLYHMCVTSLLHPAPSRTPNRIPTSNVGNRRAGL